MDENGTLKMISENTKGLASRIASLEASIEEIEITQPSHKQDHNNIKSRLEEITPKIDKLMDLDDYTEKEVEGLYNRIKENKSRLDDIEGFDNRIETLKAVMKEFISGLWRSDKIGHKFHRELLDMLDSNLGGEKQFEITGENITEPIKPIGIASIKEQSIHDKNCYCPECRDINLRAGLETSEDVQKTIDFLENFDYEWRRKCEEEGYNPDHIINLIEELPKMKEIKRISKKLKEQSCYHKWSVHDYKNKYNGTEKTCYCIKCKKEYKEIYEQKAPPAESEDLPLKYWLKPLYIKGWNDANEQLIAEFIEDLDGTWRTVDLIEKWQERREEMK